jgi:hypothetical protein
MDGFAALSRRSFGARSVRLLLTVGLLRYSVRADAVGGSLKWSVRPWLQALEEVSAALRSRSVTPTAWQREVEAVLAKMDLADLLRSIDFEAMAAAARFPAVGEGMDRLYFLDEDGRLQPLAFRPFLFTLQRSTAVVPHGHHNMATMHMVLQGSARVRHFDRLETTDTHMLIRATSDVVVGGGAILAPRMDRAAAYAKYGRA